MKVRIVGLGCRNNEVCAFCGGAPSIYVKHENFGMIPACNNCVGSGALGDMADIEDAALTRMAELALKGKTVSESDALAEIKRKRGERK